MNALFNILALLWLARTFYLFYKGHRDFYAYVWPFIDGGRLIRRIWQVRRRA